MRILKDITYWYFRILLFSRERNRMHAKMTRDRKKSFIAAIEKTIEELKSKNNELAIENTKIVLATGEYDLRFYKTIGRLQVDMYTYFRRDFNLASYKLDDVAGQYISDSIKHFTNVKHDQHGEITELYSKNLSGLHVGDYIHIELSSFTSDYYKSGKKFQNVENCYFVVKKLKCLKNSHFVKTVQNF